MKKLSARRRHPLAALVVLLFALAVTGGLYAAFAPADKAQADDTAQSLAVKEGKKLFAVGCASCHGTGGQGTSDGPSLVGVGAAAVDFQVGTGRMPAQQPGAQVPRKKNIYTNAQIDQLAAYVASLGPGPSVPSKEQYSADGADIGKGGELFRTNCAQCHNFTGKGGALTDGKFAPTLEGVDPKHIYEAMETGPQNMPSFGDGSLSKENKKDIIAYLGAVNGDESESPGGLDLGGLGPVSEGLFGYIFGLGALIAVAIWVAARTTKAKKS
ncbi:menaquinol-cytochrome c reductase cytochrome c1 subunit precursor [Streptomyces sp. 2224.1]|uniref:Cytochrome bc1 complex cytochrome c subunit n=1 Tax=Streptomyces mooreae TaxID=3075523 RepID=A0ABU2TG00_9ACTN|nr:MULTISPECIES: c-type cytochrome [unclassified Streptomyces]MDT0459840.1 c-type cytochrome [Streptomyces sp. DSM 41527]PBC81965.1 menaquinol-cytochrome c reductase cytochrome c1 subunit precursor [Streptomyces sp. 2321.6]SDR52191.1 menaquinol-cytochrome c reductase cytochrome c1 subunit precursor [Streptomyces sp. KS_16]SEC38016.1 menaquinol-cytochrome c reductase cytochrome c1 subunit precursor [Streptomyces sp. 2133.1]SEC65344.1 menaquinol-cytochrome c reductase cytochrome c1 subunit precu